MMLRKKEILSILVVLLVMLPSVNAAVTTDYKANTSQKDEITNMEYRNVTPPITQYINDINKSQDATGLKKTLIKLQIYDELMFKLHTNLPTWDVHPGAALYIVPRLFAGNKALWRERINFEIYDARGTLLKKGVLYGSFSGIICLNSVDYTFYSKRLRRDDYKLRFIYKGNENAKLAPCSTDIILRSYT